MHRWWIAAPSRSLRRTPLAVTIQDEQVVLFRDRDGRGQALQDRCPHRGYALSGGHCQGGRLVCGYHGWAFDGQGVCRHRPGGGDTAVAPVPVYAVLEQDGYVWVAFSHAPGEVPRLSLGTGAWQPWTAVLAVSPAALGPALEGQGWRRLAEPAAADGGWHGEADGQRFLLHLIPETATRTRLEVLAGPRRWWDRGPRRFRSPRRGLPPALRFAAGWVLSDPSPA